MKRRIFTALVFIGALAALGAGIPAQFNGSDVLRFGVSSSTDDKAIEFNTGDGASNVQVGVDDSLNGYFKTDALSVGDGAASDKSLIFDVGAGGSNPFFKWDNTLGKLQFSNDGTSVKSIGSGSGGGGGVNLAEIAGANTDCESGSPPSNYTVSGGTLSAETTSELFGTQSCNWDSDGSAQTLLTDAFTIPIGLQGTSCLVQMKYSYEVGSSGDYAIQAYDGTNILSTVDIPPTLGVSQFIFPPGFTCPSSGTLQLRLLSQVADADPIIFESVHVGSNIRETQVAEATLYATSRIEATTDCAFSSTSATYANYAADSDCPTQVVTGRATALANPNVTPSINFGSLPPGKYVVRANGKFLADSTSGNLTCSWVISDGTDRGTPAQIWNNTTNDPEGSKQTIEGTFIYTTIQSSPVFQVQVRRDNGSDGCVIQVDDTDVETDLEFIVERYPLETETAVLLSEGNGWHIDASVGGATINMSTNGSASTYEAVQSDSGLSVIVGSGSASAQAVCTTGEAPSGLTCSSNDERLGLAFTIPFAGQYEVCGTFPWVSNSTTAVQETFQWHETGLSDDTSVQAGLGTASVRSGTNADTVVSGQNVHLCGVFNFSSVGQKSIKLFHEYVVNASATSNDIVIDRSASLGQRDANITVRPINKNFPMPMILDVITAPTGGGVSYNYATAQVDSRTGSFGVVTENGSWISSYAEGTADDGISTVNINAGVFTSAPVCTVTTDDQNRKCSVTSASTSAVEVTCLYDSVFSANIDANGGVSDESPISWINGNCTEQASPFEIDCTFDTGRFGSTAPLCQTTSIDDSSNQSVTHLRSVTTTTLQTQRTSNDTANGNIASGITCHKRASAAVDDGVFNLTCMGPR